jgi:hypothetical protein
VAFLVLKGAALPSERRGSERRGGPSLGLGRHPDPVHEVGLGLGLGPDPGLDLCRVNDPAANHPDPDPD